MKCLRLFVSKTNFRKKSALVRFFNFTPTRRKLCFLNKKMNIFPEQIGMKKISKDLEFGKENEVSTLDMIGPLFHLVVALV